MNLKTLFVSLATLGFAASPAIAGGSLKDTPTRAHPSVYVHLFGGVAFLDETEYEGIIGGNLASVDTEQETGFSFGGAIGAYIPQLTTSAIATRGEIEVSYRETDVDGINFSLNGPAPEVNVAGDIGIILLMANLIVDFKVNQIFTPFIGVGAGVAFTQQDFVYGPPISVGDSSENFAAQIIAGFNVGISSKVDLTFDGRYTRIYDVSSSRDAPSGASTGIIETDLDSFSLNAGIRYRF